MTMDILLLAVGTRGDIQPFIAVGVRLREAGYRVRLATHAVFRDFVASAGAGLDFFPLGGDPVSLARCAAETGGIFPPRNFKAVDELRHQINLYLEHQLDACTQPDPEAPDRPFKAEAIIANPISYGHIHLADHLGLPLHFLWTQPETATRAFAHPQARFLYEKMWQTTLTRGSLGGRLVGGVNYVSYAGIHCAMAMGVGDLLSKFRRQQLHAPPLWHLRHYHRLFDPPVDRRRPGRRRSRATPIPASYVYSPSLVPRPSDWPDHVQVAGYCHAPAEDYRPDPHLLQFLGNGPPPVYFGFGSMPVNKPEQILKDICGAVAQTGQRALLLADDWGEHAKSIAKQHEDRVLLVGPVPHSWLFPCCAAVVHHGGAGTTGAGLVAGRPTAVLPAFADQAFWPIFVNRAGAGPRPVAVERVTQRRLVGMLTFMARPEVIEAAKALGARIAAEPDGALEVVRHFEHHLAQWRQAQPVAHRLQQAARAKPPAAAQRQMQQQAAQPSQQPQDGVPQLLPPAPSGQPAPPWPRSEALPQCTSNSTTSSQGAQQVGDSGSHDSDSGGCCRRSGSTGEPVGSIAHSRHAHDPPSSSLQCPANSSRSQHSPQNSGRSLGGRRGADCSGVDSCGTTAPHTISIRVSSSLLDDMESGWSSSRSLQVVQADANMARDALPASARYFRPKRVPLLTAWVEGCKALGQTLLLPLISMVPCNGVVVDAK